MQWFVSMIFSKAMHRPSSEKLWQMPHAAALPNPPCERRETPLEAHDTSYLAASTSTFSFPITCSPIIAANACQRETLPERLPCIKLSTSATET